MNNPENNAILRIFEGPDSYEIEKAWKDFAEQSTIEIIDQSATVAIHNDGARVYHVFLWFKWSKAGRG
jgi:hypothetical protein